jgi:hypothetical protein
LLIENPRPIGSSIRNQQSAIDNEAVTPQF